MSDKFFPIDSCERIKTLAPDARLWAMRLDLPAPARMTHMPFETEWKQSARKWATKTANDLTGDLTLGAYRQFLSRIGLRKVRPAAENLIRRFMLGKAQPVEFSLNPLVDAGNTTSTESGIPVAMFDASRLSEPLCLTVSNGGETFLPIGSDPMTLDPGTVILKDQARVVSLFCCRDGDHTKVTADTTRLLILACQVDGVDEMSVKYALQRTHSLIQRLS